ncbi:hypothetical protein OC25_02850 [Pedobacter kyungheensis]|uniref:Uncharacterized protein n=1 Tax=Pedobacter kyungheensis TaxID=1069985 RepID=A0A0C1FXY6_9SPHI|nr:hypothetical protein OC25_02850 [Pedobacter kyungheensis]
MTNEPISLELSVWRLEPVNHFSLQLAVCSTNEQMTNEPISLELSVWRLETVNHFSWQFAVPMNK